MCAYLSQKQFEENSQENLIDAKARYDQPTDQVGPHRLPVKRKGSVEGQLNTSAASSLPVYHQNPVSKHFG